LIVYDSGEESLEPVVDIFVPLLDESIVSYDVYNDKNSTVLDEKTFRGFFALSIYWRAMMKDTLPEGSDGIILVVENECAPSFTYQINGPRVQYLGGEDHHDKAYEYLEMASGLLDLRQFATKGLHYTGTPIVDNYCRYNIRVFPSDVVRAKYTSRTGVIFVVCALLIFGITSAFFMLYDLFVERRQKIVYSSAVRSEAIVSSLFPSTVRARIGHSGVSQSRTDDDFRKGSKPTKSASNKDDAPIADLFQNTTIFFADIA
jgi:hypothetical protein